jgi:phosphate-selective porin OprO/OprP
MKKLFLMFVTLLLTVAWHAPAMAETTQDHLNTLEKKIKSLENEIQQIKNTSTSTKSEELIKKKKATPVFAFWKNDFYLSTPDENFWMKIRGNVHFDTKFYGGNSGNPTHFDIRRARMDFQGEWYKYIFFRVQGEFADNPYIRNAFVDFKFADWLHLRAGQMKPPFSTSWWTMDNNVNFIERAASTPMYTYFDRGWWFWGDVLNNTLTWNLGAFTGAGMEYDYNKGDIDDHKDYVARLFYTPFKNQDNSIFKGLNLCVQGTIGKQSVSTKRFEQKDYGGAVRDDAFWEWADNNAEIDSRDRWGAELHYILGPVSLSSEYLVTRWSDIERVGVVKKDGEVTSWSTWVSYFLTGEQKKVSNFGWKQPNPKINFDPINFKGTGAWEVLARYTSTKTSDSLFDHNILTGASRVDEYTAGLAWTWNPMVRWQLNYVHLNGNGIRTGSGDSGGYKYVDNEDMVGLRMIFKF